VRGSAAGILLFALLAAGAGWIAWAAGEARRAHPSPVETRLAPRAAAPAWTGSDTCAECHPEIWERWKKSTHSRATREFAPEHPAHPFDGGYWTARGIDFRMGPGGQMEADGPGGDMKTYDVHWVLGARRIQMFTTRMDRGRIQVLPVFVEVPKHAWFDYADFIFGGPRVEDVPPDSPNAWYGPARNFNTRCGDCHVGNFAVNYDADAGTYASTWSELVIGCEACHGAGGKHVDKWRNLTDDPEPLVDLKRLPVSRANQNCGFCHSESVVIRPGFRPGDDLFEFKDVNGIEDEVHAYPDGRASGLFHNLILVMEEKCGELSCTYCHDPHGGGIPGDLHRPLDWNGLCANCHDDILADVEAHTFHPAGGPGSRCVDCHLAPITIEAGHGRVRDHTLSTPSPRVSSLTAAPNACVECHLEQPPGWDEEWIERWWPGAEDRNHRTKLAAAIAAARTRKDDAQALLEPLLDDPNPVYRAAATWYLSRYDVDLRPMLDDAHPLVRRAAVRGVANRHPEALAGLLDAPNAVLRSAVAVDLAGRTEKDPFDYMRDHPALREKVLATLEDVILLRPDRAHPHYLAGALHELAGRYAEAKRCYERYLRLNPFDDRVAEHVKRLP